MTDQPLGPIHIRNELARLLTAVEREQRLVAELDRAKREFFAANPAIADQDTTAAELAALRFVEWYLCERASEFLGAVPIEVGEARLGVEHRVPIETVVGVFLVQRGGDEPSVRDLIDNTAYELVQVPEPLEIGDALIGRLFASDDEDGHIPSAAASIVKASPRFAIAFQQDVKNLDLGRRLSQVELEHLLFREEARRVAAKAEAPPPLEHVEAEFGKVLAEAGRVDLSPTEISDAIRHSERPTKVIEGLLDELAFETDVDLEATRIVLWRLAASVQSSGPVVEDAEDSDHPEITPLIREARPPKRRPSAPPASEPADADPTSDESLGARIARRIEEGLSGAESVEAVFADVEELMGESIDDDEDDAGSFDDGDLDPLVREFAWECEADKADVARLDGFVAMQRVAPVPVTTLEAVDQDDVLRFLLLAWLDQPTRSGAAEVVARYRVLERFFQWSKETQEVDRVDALAVARADFVDPLERLAAATAALVPAEPALADPERETSGGTLAGAGSAPDLFTVVEVDADQATLRALRPGDRVERRVRRIGSMTEWESLRREDLVLGRIDPDADRFDGIAIVLPQRVQRLLG